MRLHNKVIIVTGSTTGIGKGIARRCVAEGARVLIHGLEQNWANDLIRELGEDWAAACICDLADEASYALLVNAALSRFGRIDAIVNNAAKVASKILV